MFKTSAHLCSYLNNAFIGSVVDNDNVHIHLTLFLTDRLNKSLAQTVTVKCFGTVTLLLLVMVVMVLMLIVNLICFFLDLCGTRDDSSRFHFRMHGENGMYSDFYRRISVVLLFLHASIKLTAMSKGRWC